MRLLSAGRRAAAAGAGAAGTAGLLWGAYLTLIGTTAARFLREAEAEPSTSAAGSRFRLLVPAHDEEKMLASTLESLEAIDYPQDRFEVHVVADNCTDETAAIGRAYDVTVHERHSPEDPGKGPALSWLIDRLPEGGPDDIFVVVDADTLVQPGILHAFDAALKPGTVAAQGHYKVRDAELGGDVGFRAIALAVRHLVRPAGRVALGGSSSLYGNGMAFREEIARSHRWSAELTEDLEMGLRLLLDGHLVAFAPRAEVEAAMPESTEAARSQNERWEAGRIRIAAAFVPRLLRAARLRSHGRRWAYVDAAIDISLPPLTTVAALSSAGVLGGVVCGRRAGRVRIVGIAGLGVALQIAHVVHAMRLAGTPSSVRRSLLRAPAQVVWKSRLVARVARHRPESWIRTSRRSATET